jgi:hypothetical protein
MGRRDCDATPPSVPKVPDRGPAEIAAERRAQGYGPVLDGLRDFNISRRG